MTHFESIYNSFVKGPEEFCFVNKLVSTLLKSFSQEVDIKLKSIVSEFVNFIILNFYEKLPKLDFLKNSLMSIIIRLIIILGNDSNKYISWMICDEVQVPTMELFDESIKMLQNAVQLNKASSKELISNTFQYLYFFFQNKEVTFNIESDEQRDIINNLTNFIKLISIISNEIPDIYYDLRIKNVEVRTLMEFCFNNLIYFPDINVN